MQFDPTNHLESDTSRGWNANDDRNARQGRINSPHVKVCNLAAELEVQHGLAAWPARRRQELLRALDAGELAELEFEAIVYRHGKNANHVRFRGEEMDAFAASFIGAPFLRNHDTGDIGSRDGTVMASSMQGVGEGYAMRQTIRLTTPRGLRDFLMGIIDRFSISWYWEAIECSVCGENWLACPHQPGYIYANGGRQATCELIFIHPRGKETSAVNAPAVPDTYVLYELLSLKENETMSIAHHDSHLEPNLASNSGAQPVGDPAGPAGRSSP